MVIKKYSSGFTLVELLVVVSVIAVLSALTVVYLNSARMTARDARRISDVKQIQLALKMYYNDNGVYPTYITSNESIANGNTVYLSHVPSNPQPRTDNGCPDKDYQYGQIEAGKRYSLTFCLGDKTDDLDAGVRAATHNGILNCPTGYVAVPGSRDLNTNDFCVMKYEAKCGDPTDPTYGMPAPIDPEHNTYDPRDGRAICSPNNNGIALSVSSGYPIANIGIERAREMCQAVGAHLITNAEWTTIARNAEGVANAEEYNSNWSEGVVGQGYMPGGIKAEDKADEAIEEYFYLYHAHPSRRTLILSTGERIWDFSGGVSEWVDNTCDKGSGVGQYDDTGGVVQWNELSLANYELPMAGPSDAAFYQNEIGGYSGCTVSGNAFIRGGSASEDAGIYSLRLDHEGNYADSLLGFRCVKN